MTDDFWKGFILAGCLGAWLWVVGGAILYVAGVV